MTVYAASLKAPNIPTGLSGGSMPWVDPIIAAQAIKTAQAGVMLTGAMAKSRGSMGLGNKV